MRKFAAVAALAVIGAAFAGAQEKSIHELGLAVPLWNQSLTVFMNANVFRRIFGKKRKGGRYGEPRYFAG